MTTFTWTYPSNRCMASLGGHTNVVTMVEYKCAADDTVNQVEMGGFVQMAAPGDPFIEFADLTQQIVEDWVQAGNLKISVEACLQGQLDSLANPPVTPIAVAFPF